MTFPEVPSAEAAKAILKVLGAFAAAAALIFAVWWVFIHPHQAAQEAAQAQTDAAAAQAQADAATGSIVILNRRNAEQDAIDKTTEDASHDIHQAPGADAQINPGLDAAGRRALCLHDGRANDPQCVKLLHPDS